ncbi:carbohydrate binding domain-containing protein [Paenibacillus sp. J5C_2022]|uniref:carbohydrate binding domain-containing protein n=1 Tax=Paenibacillus sp. J5C2022 TaxID=2977129 RepID=UPI0021CEE9C5|nr:carbohydrate binding domain-containing protein [Paenibacillus sp. J5C2022]MCU6710369.1 carbohydrate binding domain-containing protein [Paenibacillus sp. J5C2022]
MISWRSMARKIALAALTATVLLPLGAGLAPSVSAAEPSIANHSFEQPEVNGNIPGWTQTFGATGISIDQSIVYEGERSLKLEDASATSSIGIISDKFAVEANMTYTVTVQAYGVNGGRMMYMYFYDANNQQLEAHSQYISIPYGQWETVSMERDAPDNAVRAAVLFYSSVGETGTTYFDNIQLLERMPIDTISLGVPLHTIAVNGAAFGIGTNGQELAYAIANGSPAVLNVIDAHTGVIENSFSLPGAGGSFGAKTGPDGTVYIGSFPNGTLYRWVPGSSSIESLGRPLPSESYIWQLDFDEDGRVYGVTYPNGKVFRYDPATGDVHDYGSMIEGMQYARSIGIYEGKAYVGVGTQQVRMVELNLATGDKREILLPEPYRQDMLIYDMDVRKHSLFVRPMNSSDMLVYDLKKEEWKDIIPDVKGLGVSPVNQGKMVYLIRNDNFLYKYNMHTGELCKTSFGNLWSSKAAGWIHLESPDYPGSSYASIDFGGRIRIYNPLTGNHQIIESSMEGQPAIIQSLGLGPDGRIYASGYQSGGLSAYDPATGNILEYPKGTIGQIEGMITYDGKLYAGVYPGADLFSYDPAQPYDYGTNPQLHFGLKSEFDQDRPFALTGVGEQLAIGTVPDYGKLGGALTMYNPNSGEKQVYRNVVSNQSVTALASKDGIVYGGTSVWGGLGITPSETEAKLFIWNPATDEKEWEGVPISGDRAIVDLAFDDQGYLWGLTVGKVFKFDPATREVIAVVNILPFNWDGVSHVWKNGSLLLAPDGHIYVLTLTQLFRLDPVTLETTLVKNQAGYFAAMDLQGDVYYARDTELYKLDMNGDGM